ncbi:hypothetical protein QBC40DRAFT_190251 [Triangularia verruculosa]|uniref:DNA polymerase lambda n=1 Tax=Triangularia verruculosa TaxID=2587418 RepID=A0AAN6XRK2_9PEZI|nr:hypothetical protein QBC40DRAFT_190251 [Triangularia verruculosa]
MASLPPQGSWASLRRRVPGRPFDSLFDQSARIIPSSMPESSSNQRSPMDEDPLLEEKVAFFDQLDALAKLDDEDDRIGAKEQQHRDKCKAFFRPGTVAAQENPVSSPRPHLRLRRTASVPTPTAPTPAPRGSAEIIKATPDSQSATDNTLTRARRRPLTDSATSIVAETPIPDSAQPRVPTSLRRSMTMPTSASAPGGAEQSPSASTALRKRKRSTSGKAIPEAAQIFRGLSFFYIPNDNIAPARKLRISKAQDYGAEWVRSLHSATHVIVDKHLSYSDIQKIPDFGLASSLVIVNDEYPIDSISFRTLLNPDQRRHRVSGLPSSTLESTIITVPSQESEPSLQIKEPRAIRRQDTAGSEETPRQEDSSLESSRRTRSKRVPSLGIEIQSSIPPPPSASTDSPKDELSCYIELLQQYKGLPLDNEDEDDHLQSTKDAQEDSDPESASEDDRARKKPATRSRTSLRKSIPFEGRFACNRGGTKDNPSSSSASNPNARTIEVLQSMCDYYTKINDHWRITAYRKAITTLRQQTTKKITTAEEAYTLPNIGHRIADKIEEICNTNTLRRLNYANQEPMDKVLDLFLKIHDVGLARANKWISQGYRTLDDLVKKADLTSNQKISIEHYTDLTSRIPRAEVAQLAAFVQREAFLLDPDVELVVGGSYRRGADSSGDVDFIITKRGTSSSSQLIPFMNSLISVLYEKGFLTATLSQSRRESEGSKFLGCCRLPPGGRWRRIDLLLVPETEYGAALIYFTGNDIFNRSLRLLAGKKGMRLNQRGLFGGVMRGKGRVKVTAEGELVEGGSERRIFEVLGVRWRAPEERWC